MDAGFRFEGILQAAFGVVEYTGRVYPWTRGRYLCQQCWPLKEVQFPERSYRRFWQCANRVRLARGCNATGRGGPRGTEAADGQRCYVDDTRSVIGNARFSCDAARRVWQQALSQWKMAALLL